MSWRELPGAKQTARANTMAVASGRVFFLDDGNIQCWNAVTNEIQTIIHEKATGETIACSLDGNTIAFQTIDSRVVVADTSTGEHIMTLPPIQTRLNSFSFAPDGQRLFVKLANGFIHVWRLDLIEEEVNALSIKRDSLAEKKEYSPLQATVVKLGRSVMKEFPESDHRIAYVRQPDFLSAQDPMLSNDGRQLYFTANAAKRINCLNRDTESGGFVGAHSFRFPVDVAIWSIQLSPTNDMAVACGRSSLLLYERSRRSGELVQQFSYSAGNVEHALPPIFYDASFSSDGRFVFVCDSQGDGTLRTFAVTHDEELEQTFSNSGQEDCFIDITGIVVHPNGEWLYVAAASGAITFCRINKESGETFVEQVVRDQNGAPPRIGSAHSLTISDDQRFLYVSSGHNHFVDAKTTAVNVLRIDDVGHVSIVQTILPGVDGVPEFHGGIGFVITPDQSRAFVCASRSHHLLEFARDPESGALSMTRRIPIGRGQSRPTGVAVAPDGRFLYVTLSRNHAIATIPLD